MRKGEVSYKTVVFVILFVLGLGFLYYIRDILFQVLVSLIIVSSFNPFVTRLEKYKIPRAFGATIAYFIFLGIVSFAVYIVAPSFVNQMGNFVNNVPRYITNINLPDVFKQQILEQFLVQLGQLPSQFAKASVMVFSNIIDIVAIFILSFYLLLSRNKLNDTLADFFGTHRSEKIVLFINKIENRIGRWAKAEIFLMLLVGSLNFVGLLLLRVPYALPLAIIAGLLEIVPMVGPFLAAVPAVIIAFNTSLFTGIATAALAFLVQQVENYVFVPRIMQKSAGLNPVITLLALSIGFRIQGTVGALIAIPTVLAIQVFVDEYLIKKKERVDNSF